MVRFKGFEVGITVGGKDLQEHEKAESTATIPDNTVVRYVESVTGAPFEIRSGAVKRDFAQIKIAGTCILSFIHGMDTGFLSSVIRESYPFQGKISGKVYRQSDQIYSQAFTFDDLRLNDAELPRCKATENAIKEAALIGVIELKLRRLSKVSPSTLATADHGERVKVSGNALSEKLFKGRAISHRVKYGKSQPIPCGELVDVVGIDTSKSPFLCFKFYYMSRAKLQSIGLIHRTPSPVPLELRNLEGLSREELMELVKSQKERLEVHSAIKRETSAQVRGASKAIGIKRAVLIDNGDDLSIVSTRRVRQRTLPGESVDLTED